MARIRSIHPGIFTDEAFASLSMGARVLLLGVWTEADDHGVFEWKPVTLKMRVMPVDNVSIPDLLAECERADVIKRFSSGKSYGLVRNFCRYQRPKKPKYTHPIPSELYTYAGLKPDGSLLVLHQSRTSGENEPQREEEGGEGEEERGIGIEKGRETPSVLDSRAEEDKPKPIDENYQPSDAAIEYAFSLGMKKADLNSELSKFVCDGKSKRAVSFDLDASFKKRCDQWRDYQRKTAKPKGPEAPSIEPVPLSDSDWRSTVKRFKSNRSQWSRHAGPEPGMAGCRCPVQVLVDAQIDPASGHDMTPSWHFIDHTTNEMAAFLHDAQSRRMRAPAIFKFEQDGVERCGFFSQIAIPPGYDEATGERIAPSDDEAAA